MVKRFTRLSGDFRVRIPSRALLDPLLDGAQLYSYRYRNALESSTGLERLALLWLGPDVLRSVTLTLDVFSRFEAGYVKIAPVNRTRVRTTALGYPRQVVGSNLQRHTARGTTLLVCPVTASVSYTKTPIVTTGGTNAFDHYRVSRDTTSRTRPFGSDYGEFESIKFESFSPGPRISQYSDDRTLVYLPPCPYPQESSDMIVRHREWTGDFMRIPSSVLKPFLDSELAATKAMLPSIAIKMLPSIGPDSRRYTLFRNLVEIKDIPRSITQLRSSLESLQNAYLSVPLKWRDKVFSLTSVAKNIPKEYLSYQFGWRQTFKDVTDLLALPEKLSKELNFLISRSGKPTTYRASRKFPGIRSTSPTYTDYINSELFATTPVVTTSVERDHEVRVVINSTFDFPEIGVPVLRSSFLRRKIGLTPTISDLYDLVPWSWLLDWFTGVGDYVHAMDYINSDRSLINYGFATGITNIRIIGHFRSSYRDRRSINVVGEWSNTQEVFRGINQTSLGSAKVQARLNLAKLGGVSVTSDIGTLSLYQQSILGALLTSRNPMHHSRS